MNGMTGGGREGGGGGGGEGKKEKEKKIWTYDRNRRSKNYKNIIKSSRKRSRKEHKEKEDK